MRKFIYLCSHLCVQVPLLPIAVLTVIPLAVCPSWRPWGAADIPVLGNPGVGQWIVIIVVAYTIIDTVRGMIDDLRHGRVGVDLLAVVAIAATVAVQEYWASWAVVLMISSGEAIEEYAQSKAESSLTALMTAAPQTAHVVRWPGVGVAGVNTGDGSSDDRCDGFRKVAALPSSTASGSSDAATSHYDTVAVESVTPGDVLIVLPGETVPVDGELLSGSATLDLSNINGEPVPRGVLRRPRHVRRGERLDHADHACHRSRQRLAIPAHPRARRGRAGFPPGGW